MNTNRYPYKCYKMLRNLDENDRVTWASKVGLLLFRYGFGYIWITENVGNENAFMKIFKQRLIDCSKQNWCSMIEASSKARHYRFISPTSQVSNYICYDLPLKFRISLSKIKCSVHSLNVEVGRHRNIIYNERFCTLCNRREVEDEFHFVIKCPVYKHLRDIYLPNIDTDRVTVNEFHLLFNGNRAEVLNLAKYIFMHFR